MAISDNDKLDRSFKYTQSKAFTTAQKDLNAEDASTGPLIGTSSIFAQDAAIPTTAPGTSTSVLTFYGDGTSVARFRMISDIASPLNTAFYASTDGSTLTTMRATRLQNWVSTQYGNYTVRMFLTSGSSTTNAYVQEIFFSDSTSPVFDYKAGILTFETDPVAFYSGLSPTPDGIQISGYLYIGPLLSQIFDANGNFSSGLSNFGDGSSITKYDPTSKTLNVSAPHAIGTTWTTETTPYGTTNVMWGAVTETASGIIIAVGGDEANTTPYAAYSYGNGVWKNALILSLSNNRFRSIWASPDGYNIYAVDSAGVVGHSTNTGRNWNAITPPITAIGIWGNATTDIYIVGSAGGIAHSTNGTSFSTQTNSDSNNLNAVWSSGATDIFAVGAAGTIRHSTGSGTFTGQTSGTSNALNGVFGFSSTEVYAVGASGTVIKYNGTSWSAFNTGIPSNFTCTSIFGVLANGVRRLYISGIDNSSNYHIYFSSGTNSWASQNTFSGTATEGGTVFGGTNGVYVGLNGGRIGALHQNYAEEVVGNAKVDGYLLSTALFTTDAEISTLNVSSASTFTAANRLPALSITGLGTSTFTNLTSSSADTGEGVRLWREAPTVYTIDLGSLVSTGGDGVTPYAAGGRIRLGGFTSTTTSRAEIETVSSVGLKIMAYQGDMTIANLFGTSGSTSGDVNITTQNGTIRLTAVGTESPYPAGQIDLTPGTSAYVVLSSNTNSTFFKTQSPSGNFNRLDGSGSFINSGSITSGTTIVAGTSITAGTNVTSTALMTAGTTLRASGGIVTGTLSPGWTSGNHKIEAQGDINCWGGFNVYNDSGNIVANSGSVTAGNIVSSAHAVYAGTALAGSLRMDGAIASVGTYHYGLWVTVASLFGASHVAAWGMGINPCTVNTYFDTVCVVSARLTGVTGVFVTTDLDNQPLKRDIDAYWPGGAFGNEFMIMLEWHTNSSSPSGFTYGGRATIY